MKRTFTILFSILFAGVSAYAQPGTLDSSFVGTGILLTDISGGTETSSDIIVQPDGKILVAMAADYDPSSLSFDFVVMRFQEDGTVDSSFAVNGIYHYENPLGSDIPYDMELLDDGSIFVAGSYSGMAGDADFMVIKLDADGNPDPAFGQDGAVVYSVDAGLDYARGIAVRADGKILLAGYSHVPNFSFKRDVVMRLHSDGALDTIFGNNGIFMWNDNSTSNELYAVIEAPDGGILTSGFANPGGTNRIALYKVLEDGQGLDTLFGNNGEVLAPIEGKGYGLLMHPNGNILVGGNSFNNATGSDFAVLAYNQDGSPNTNFGNNGSFFGDADVLDYGLDIAIQSDGKILISGESGQGFLGPPRRFTTARCDADGILDTSWGDNGIVKTVTSTVFAFANAVTVQPADGKVLVTGASASSGGNDLTIVRYGNFIDADMDGYSVAEDCDDNNMDVNPGAPETPYNGIDDDCNPMTPDDDLDDDGFVLAEDCDDMNADINPNAEEIVYNGLDDDCDPLTLDDDLDGDGYVLAEDCDDMNVDINPGNDETPYNGIDDDCDPMTPDDDLDGDGFVLAEDCDDMNVNINPGNDETPYNGIDDDCDPMTPDDDLDGDGFVLAEDCDDMNADINPDAIDIPNNGIDEDCDGMDATSSSLEALANAHFRVYPNPTSGDVNLVLDEQFPTVLKIELFNSVGKRLYSALGPFSDAQIQLTTADLPSGILNLCITTKQGVHTKRIVKK
jgi:uncharacterized delta-60 repeat protein